MRIDLDRVMFLTDRERSIFKKQLRNLNPDHVVVVASIHARKYRCSSKCVTERYLNHTFVFAGFSFLLFSLNHTLVFLTFSDRRHAFIFRGGVYSCFDGFVF